ncbi:chalcone--flavonone isomerase [Phtheirospermum japonicum]|uniref:Chalcone-flavonone isomerase family protein n=1 Tax=Phtheirospermum japonicum TaxID=374723 RepID=A0A830CRY9_9LAMI|nr:chalcone--flavonone isomerase [Phtheirospermum japonicum]
MRILCLCWKSRCNSPAANVPGVRGLEIGGKFVKFTAIGVYLEGNAVPSLAVKWKGKSAKELTDSVGFFADIITGPFEKFTKIITIMPLTGQQYSEKVAEKLRRLLESNREIHCRRVRSHQ